MATENGPGEDVSPIENGDFNCHVSSPEGKGIGISEVDFFGTEVPSDFFVSQFFSDDRNFHKSRRS